MFAERLISAPNSNFLLPSKSFELCFFRMFENMDWVGGKVGEMNESPCF